MVLKPFLKPDNVPKLDFQDLPAYESSSDEGAQQTNEVNSALEREYFKNAPLKGEPHFSMSQEEWEQNQA